MFHATGLTGWQRAVAEEQASGEPAPSTTAPPPSQQAEQSELTRLREQAGELSRSLEAIQNRLAELEGKAREAPTGEPAGQ
jgi:hypothetical protein